MEREVSIVLSKERSNYRKLAQSWYGLTDEQMRGMDVHHNPPRSEGGRNIPEHLYVYHPSLHRAVHGNKGSSTVRLLMDPHKGSFKIEKQSGVNRYKGLARATSPSGRFSPIYNIGTAPMEKVYRDVLESLSKAAEKSAADSNRIKELAILAGAEEKDLTLHNALLACERVIGEYLDLKQEAEKLGTSLPNALKSYRMASKRAKVLVPDILTAIPPHWVLRENRSVKEARKLSKALQADLKELYKNLAEAHWMTDEEKEEYSRSVIECFQKESYEDFKLFVLRAVLRLRAGIEA